VFSSVEIRRQNYVCILFRHLRKTEFDFNIKEFLMTVKLVNTDLNEMMMEFPSPSFPMSNRLEKSRFTANNAYVNVSFAEIRTSQFSIYDVYLQSREEIKIHLRTEKRDVVWFCAALQGSAVCCCHPQMGEERWQSGYANLLTCDDVDSCLCFNKDKAFRMMEIMLSPAYLEGIAGAYPSLFGEILSGYADNPFFRAFPENIPFCPAISEALSDLPNYKRAGKAAPMYLDAKIREILSLFLCRSEKADSPCSCYSPKDRDMLIWAKDIIEREYLNPPSLHELALMVGTNECKLKNGFKTLFGTTVFGHLFDHRMKLACQYFSDTDKTIQEIAELTGYEHQSHFSTAFKRKFHVSPQEYRNRHSPMAFL
jgi:AraC-like DNA-binding protein